MVLVTVFLSVAIRSCIFYYKGMTRRYRTCHCAMIQYNMRHHNMAPLLFCFIIIQHYCYFPNLVNNAFAYWSRSVLDFRECA